MGPASAPSSHSDPATARSVNETLGRDRTQANESRRSRRLPPMPRKRQKRGREGGGGGGGGGGDGAGGDVHGGGGRGGSSADSPAPALKRLCLPCDPCETSGCSCSCSQQQQGFPTTGCPCVQAFLRKFQPAVSRFLAEVTGAFTSLCDLPPVPREGIKQDLPPTYKLTFVNTMSHKLFTMREVRAKGGDPLMIKMVVSNNQGSNYPQLLSANVKIVVLHGDFNENNREVWTLEEFESHIVRPRDNIRAVVTGKLEMKLKNGVAYLESITFCDISKFTRSGEFRLGVKLIDNHGVRVQEGITEPFTVRDRRGEEFEKYDIPELDDEVWRLERIAKKGRFCKALEQNGITLVKHFLRQYYKDEKALRSILSNVSNAHWTKMVNHAKKCDSGGALYSYFIDDKKIRLYFSSLGQIVGITINDKYKAFDDLDKRQKDLVEERCKDAYECMTYRQPDYEMYEYDSEPTQIDRSTFQGSIMPGSTSAEPTDQIMHEVDEQYTLEGNELSGVQFRQCILQRLQSRRVRAFPSAQENNENGTSFDIDDRLDYDDEIQYETPEANCVEGSVIAQPPTTENEIIGHVPLVEGNYQMPFTKDDSSVASMQYSFSESDLHEIMKILEQDEPCEESLINNMSRFSAANLSQLPAHVRCFMVKLLACRRWIKLTAPVKWMAIMASSKKTRASKGKAHA